MNNIYLVSKHKTPKYMLVYDAGWNHSDKSHDGLHNLDEGTNNLARSWRRQIVFGKGMFLSQKILEGNKLEFTECFIWAICETKLSLGPCWHIFVCDFLNITR